MKIEIKKIGNSTGVILPKELLGKLQLKQGDWLFVTELPDGGLMLAPRDPSFEKGMEIARQSDAQISERPSRACEVTEPVWLSHELVIAIHDEQLAEFGGASGLRDAGALESAIARPLNQYHYGKTELAALAAAYGFGLSRNHAFVDGNKRTAFLAMVTLLGA